MAALKDIKRKITAVQKTRQITKAMNMVAASKFKTAQTRMDNFRPYAAKFMELLAGVAGRVDPEAHPLLAVRPPKRIWAICITSDRGLCGGFNNNLIRAAEQFVKEKTAQGSQVVLVPIGRKGRDHFRKRATVANARADCLGKIDMTLAEAIAEDVLPPFGRGEYDELYLLYNQFINVAVHRPTAMRLFPLAPMAGEKAGPGVFLDVIYEPSLEVLLGKLLPQYAQVQIFRALLETSAGENGARMAAMDNATRNCEELIQNLTLKYNKARQAAITAELMDIVGGTEALAKG